MADFIDIVFDGPPDHPAPRFVEVETPDGRSVNAGEWLKRADGPWVLRLPRAPAAAAIPAPLPPFTGTENVGDQPLGIRPGILRTVNLLRANGFSTRDSWDKMPDAEYAALGPDEYGWNETYIHCDVQPEILVRESHRLHELLEAAGVKMAAFNPTLGRVPLGWIECSYSPHHHGTGILSVFGVNDALLNEDVMPAGKQS